MALNRNVKISLGILLGLILFSCIGGTAYFAFRAYRKTEQLQDAMRAFERKEWTKARTLFRSVLASDRNNETAVVKLAELARMRGDPPEEAYYWFRAGKLNLLDRDYAVNYCDALCRMRNFDALAAFLRGVAPDSRTGRQSLQFAFALHATGSEEEAASLEESAPWTPLKPENADLAELVSVLFSKDDVPVERTMSALAELANSKDDFVATESLLALANLQERGGAFAEAEKTLLGAVRRNEYAATPRLVALCERRGDLTRVVELLRVYLKKHPNPDLSVRFAELLAATGRKDEIPAFAKALPQSDRRFILTGHYIDAILAFLENDMEKLSRILSLTREEVKTAFSLLMAICADAHGKDFSRLEQDVRELLEAPPFLDYRARAKKLLKACVMKSVAEGTKPDSFRNLLRLLPELDGRPDADLLALDLAVRMESGELAENDLAAALRIAPNDVRLLSLAALFHVSKNDFSTALDDIAKIKRVSAKVDPRILMLEFEALNGANRPDDASRRMKDLLAAEPSEEAAVAFWRFAVERGRETDLEFILTQKNLEFLHPFCRAELLLRRGDAASALDILEKTPSANSELVYHAAFVLASNGRNQAAIRRYRELPGDDPNRLYIDLNLSELYAEEKQPDLALRLAKSAWERTQGESVPAQICYARRLTERGELEKIADVVRLPADPKQADPELLKLWIPAMERRIQSEFNRGDHASARYSCRQLLACSPGNPVATKLLKELDRIAASEVEER